MQNHQYNQAKIISQFFHIIHLHILDKKDKAVFLPNRLLALLRVILKIWWQTFTNNEEQLHIKGLIKYFYSVLFRTLWKKQNCEKRKTKIIKIVTFFNDFINKMCFENTKAVKKYFQCQSSEEGKNGLFKQCTWWIFHLILIYFS